MTPGEHGVVGYRVAVEGEVLNVLRWTHRPAVTPATIPPAKLQPHPPFPGHRPPVVTRAEFATVRLHARPPRRRAVPRLPDAVTLVTEIGRFTAPASRSCTATTTASTRSATSTASATHYDAELRRRSPRRRRARGGAGRDGARRHRRPRPGPRGRRRVDCPADVLAHVAISRARGASAGCTPAPAGRRAARAADALLGELAWVRSRDAAVDEGWFGPR